MQLWRILNAKFISNIAQKICVHSIVLTHFVCRFTLAATATDTDNPKKKIEMSNTPRSNPRAIRLVF